MNNLSTQKELRAVFRPGYVARLKINNACQKYGTIKRAGLLFVRDRFMWKWKGKSIAAVSGDSARSKLLISIAAK